MTRVQRLPERRSSGTESPAPVASAPGQGARSPVFGIFVWSRVAIWAAAVFSYFTFQPNRHPLAFIWDDPKITHELGILTDVWARWDSVWFLRIAHYGYVSPSHADAPFYPLYPATVAGLGRVFADHYVIAGIVVSLAASLAAFFLLHRIAEERLGADNARRAVLYLAVFPMSLFLIAIYSESLFLLLSLAAFVLAERGKWVGAWVSVMLAILTRAVGFALLPPLLLLAWRAEHRKRALAGVLIPLAGFSLYPIYLQWKTGDGWAFKNSEVLWQRHFSYAGPFGGIWDGLRAAWAGIEQFASGSHTHVYWTPVQDTDPMRAATINLEAFGFLVLFVYLTIVAWRRLGAPYGLFAAASLAIPLSAPSSKWPLLSMPRFGLAIFPVFLALAIVGGRPRVHTVIVATSAILLGVTVSQWALWQWVA